MKVSTARPTALLTVAVLSTHTRSAIVTGLSVFIVLVHVGIVLPAVWSAKPTRRGTAAEVLRQILHALRQP